MKYLQAGLKVDQTFKIIVPLLAFKQLLNSLNSSSETNSLLIKSHQVGHYSASTIHAKNLLSYLHCDHNKTIRLMDPT